MNCLSPASASFRIRLRVGHSYHAVTTYITNPIRKGSVDTDEAIYDAMSGRGAAIENWNGRQLRRRTVDADAGTREGPPLSRYIYSFRCHLALGGSERKARHG